jgi:hypothetical protein
VGSANARGGAVTAIQRFGSALNLNVHFHTLAIQGVFAEDGHGGLRFVPNPEPSDLEVAKLLTSISRRIRRLAKRHGIDLENSHDDELTLDPLASESPLLAGICGTSVVGRIATGRRAGQPVLRVGRRRSLTWQEGRFADQPSSATATTERSGLVVSRSVWNPKFPLSPSTPR